MTKKLIIPIIISFFAIAAAVPALAAHTFSANGDIIVDVQDQLGNAVNGATVTLQIPSNIPGFLGLDDGLDITLTKVDGVGGASGDDDAAAADGDVEFNNMGLGSAFFNGNVWDGAPYRLTVKKAGFVEYEINDFYDENALIVKTSANKYTVKVTLTRQAPFSNALSGGSVKISNSDLTLITTVADGADGDSLNNGVIYIAQDPNDLDGGPHVVEGSAPGYILDSNSASTISSGSQTAFSFALDFAYVITADDELGGAVTLTTAADVTSSALTIADVQASGVSLYVAATGGPGDFSVTQPGYITTTTTLATYTYSDTGPQVAIALDGADGPPMDFGFVVSATRETDSASMVLSVASSTFTFDPGLTVVDEQYNAGSAYIAAYGSDLMNFTQKGFVATATTITFASAAQQAVAYSDVMFSLKVIVYNEAGTAVPGCTITHGAANQGLQDSNEYFVAATAVGALSVAKAQYRTVSSATPTNDPNTALSAIAVSSASQTVITLGASGALGETSCTAAHTAGDAATCTGLLFTVKLILYDELGTSKNMATATVNLTGNGAPDAHLAGTNRYFWLGGIANDSLSVTQNGYENMSTADDAALGDISGNTANRTVITMSGQAAHGVAVGSGSYVTVMGIKYGFKIIAEDEFGNPVNLNDTDSTVTPGPLFNNVYAITFSGGVAYLAATEIVDTFITLSHAGFVDVQTTGVWGWINTTQQTITFDGTDGPAFGYTLVVAVFDELNNPIEEALLSSGYFAVNGIEPAYIPPASNVMYFAVTSNGPLEGYLGGFAHAPMAADIALGDINPGTTTRTEVILTGTGSCGGASVAAGTQEICGGLQYNVKLPSAFTELGAPITLDNAGGEDFKVYDDPACASEVAYATTTKFAGGAYYAAPASGTPYYGGLTEPGYVSGCDAVSKTPTGAAQVLADLTGADGLKYNIKLASVYTETGAMIAALDGPPNEQLDLYTGAGCIGAAAVASGPFYFSGAWYAAAASGTDYYAEFTDTGYVDDQCSTTMITPDGIDQMEPDFTGANAMVYNLIVNSGYTELDAPITIDGDETVAVYTGAGCAGAAALASGPVYFSNAWYIAAASNTNYYVSLGEAGYVTTCDGALVNPDGTAQFSPAHSPAGGDGLPYNLMFDAAFTELDAPITIDGNEGVALYDDPACTSAAAAASGPFYVGGAWYAAAASGTNYYTAVSESGYVTACDAVAKTPDGSAQLYPDFTGAADGLKYNIMLSDATTEIDAPVTIDGNEALALFSNPDCTGAVAAASGPFYFGSSWYVAVASGSTYYASIDEPGFVTACDTSALAPDGDSQVYPSFYGSADGPKYSIKLDTVYTEIGAMLTPDGSADETMALYEDAGCATATSVASGPFYYSGAWYAMATSGVDYYAEFSDDGYLAKQCDATMITPSGAAQVSPSFSGADAMVYNIKLDSAMSELAAPLTIDGDETVGIYTDAGCVTAATVATVASGPVYFSSAWYAAAASGTNFFMQLEEPGYVRDCDADATMPDGAAQQSPSFTGGDSLMYNIKLTAAESELGLPLTIDGSAGEALAVYDDACTTLSAYASGPIYSGGAWYAAVPSGSSYYCGFAETGFKNRCDAAQVSPNGSSQVSPSFTDADGDGLLYTVKITSIIDELDNSLAVEASDTVALYSGAGCPGAAAAAATGPVYDAMSAAWYIGAEPGTFYPWYRKPGYVDTCAAISIGVATSGQTIPSFLGAGLPYGLVVSVADQYGIALSNVTLTHGGASPKYADQGPSANLYYFDTTAAAGLGVMKSGYKTITEATNTVEPGGYATGQTYLTLSGSSSGDIGTISATVPGTSVTRNGLFHQFNVQLTVQYASSSVQEVLGLGNMSNFYFENGAGDRVVPDLYSEINPTSSPGVYQFKIDTSAAAVRVKAVDVDSDPWIDAIDSDPVDLSAYITTSLYDFGTVTMYPAADYIMLTPVTDTISAGATEAITITVYDNDGTAISTGPHSMLSVQVNMYYGSVSPPSEKDIISTTLGGSSPNAAALTSGLSDTVVTGTLSSGVASLVITDNISSGASPIIVQATPLNATLTNYFAISGKSAISVVPENMIGNMLIVKDPADVTIDATATVRVEVQDNLGNIVDAGRSFQVMLTGSATIEEATHGSLTSGSGTATATVQASNGYVELSVRNTVAETITISVADPTPAPNNWTATSTQDLVFSPGAATNIVFSPTMATTGTVGTPVNVTCLVQDSGGNTTSTTDRFTIVVTGAATSTATFGTPSVGSVIAGLNTKMITVRAAAGIAVVPLTEITAQATTLSLLDSDSLGYDVSDTANITFSTTQTLRDSIAFTAAAKNPDAGAWTQYTVQVLDDYGNPVTFTSNFSMNLAVQETPHKTTSTFSLTSGGTGITTLTLTAGQTDASFYFKDTLAGAVTLDVSPSLGTPPKATTLAETISPADPVASSQSGVVMSETTGAADTGQPTGKKNAVTFSYNSGASKTILEYPYTDSSDGVIANGSQQGIVKVYLMDKYANIIADEDVTLVVSGSASVVPDTTLTTDSTGIASFYVSSSSVGTVTLRVDPPGGSSSYAKDTFAVIFTAIDLTPPSIELRGDGLYDTLTDGDYMDPTQPQITVYLEDPGLNPSGIDTGSISISVDNVEQDITVESCPFSGGIYTCTISWTNPSGISEGWHTVELTVEDQNGNQMTKEWELMVENSAVITDVLAGGDMPGGVFDPRRNDPLRISFQIPRDNTYVSLDIYNRSGRLVYSTAGVFDTGYHEFEWNGIQMSGNLPGNGIYMFRLTANIGGAVTTRTGKFAVFKQ